MTAPVGAFADALQAAKKTVIYVGGLDETVDESILAAAFRPFGDLQSVVLPKDAHTHKHRGFGLVEYVDPEDAAAALENMHDSELCGRVLKCNLAKPKGAGGAIWNASEIADEWLSKQDKSAASVDAAIQHQESQAAKKART